MKPEKSKRCYVRDVRNVTLLSCILYTRHSAITSPQVFSLMPITSRGKHAVSLSMTKLKRDILPRTGCASDSPHVLSTTPAGMVLPINKLLCTRIVVAYPLLRVGIEKIEVERAGGLPPGPLRPASIEPLDL
jgi:hypothetical protein